MAFSIALGLSSNATFSHPIGGMDDVEFLVCMMGNFPFTNLALLLGAWYKSVVAWDGIEE